MTSDTFPERNRELSPSLGTPATDDGGLDIARLVGQMLAEGKKDIYREVEIEVDRAILQAVLRYTKGNQVQASKLLGISRTTLRTKLRQLRIAIEKQVLLKFGQNL